MSKNLWSRLVRQSDTDSATPSAGSSSPDDSAASSVAVAEEADQRELDHNREQPPAVEPSADPRDRSLRGPDDSSRGAAAERGGDSKLEGLLERINHLTSNPQAASGGEPEQTAADDAPNADFSLQAIMESEGEFVPLEPRTLAQAGLTETEVESLILKYMLARGEATGRTTCDQLKLPFVLLDELLRKMKNEQLVYYRATSEANDYVYSLTDLGRERARRYSEHCTYFGAAPVTLHDYVASVKAQSIEHQRPTAQDLDRAFDDLLINKKMLARLGPAVNSGRGMFLFGNPGNGKTSIAERVTKAFGPYIWIPRALNVDGEIIRLFDPMNHQEAPLARRGGLLDGSEVDKRWVRIKRPTIVVGGELRMSNLEVTLTPNTGICESPIQLKSNCGVLVIDDFGRQQMTTDELLNRWIVPLEKRYDYLNMPSGKKIQVPFDQLVVFSTNLEPRDLVDDAFLRRIPYKIEIADPSEAEFRELFKLMCPLMGFEYCHDAIDYVIETHYKAVGRPYRCCQPRDLLLQVKNFCLFHGRPLELKPELFDYATDNYFAVM